MSIRISVLRSLALLATIALVFGVLVLFMPELRVSASTVRSVSNLNDVGIGSLRNTIASAAWGDTIVFQSSLSGTLVLSSQLTINKSLKIIGPGTTSLTISGNNVTRVFRVTDGEVYIAGMTIANGRAVGEGGHYGYDGSGGGGGGGGGATGGGGGMLIYGGAVTLDSVVFTNNSAVGGNGGHGGDGWQGWPSPDGHGGKGGNSDLIPGSVGGAGGPTGYSGYDVTYGGNYSGGGGGYGGNANYSSYIGGGNAGSGGNAYYLGGDGGGGGNKANVTFFWNKAGYGGDGGQGGGGYGGAVALTGGSLYISNSTFTGNSATGGTGGAAGSSNFKLSGGMNWYFGGSGGNGGDGKGGAIYVGGPSIGNSTTYQPGTVRIVNSTFSGNSANGGSGGYAGSHVQVGNPGDVYDNGIYNRSTIGYKNLTGESFGVYTGSIFELSGPNSARSTVTANATSVSTDGGTVTITVTLKDYGTNLVFGNKVTLVAESGNPSISPASASTDRFGQAVFTVRSTQAGSMVFAARDITAGMTMDQKVTVTFSPGQTNAGKSTVIATPSSLVANAMDSSSILVTLRDANGNSLGSGKTVTLSQNGTSTISPASAVTDSEGKVTFTVSHNIAQTVTYTARNITENVTLAQTAVVDFAPYLWSVNTLDDGINLGTLRYAITNAPPGTAITFQSGLSGVIALGGPLPAIAKDLVIDGLGANVIISGRGYYRVFEVASGTVSIKNLTVADGRAAGAQGQHGADGSTNYQYGYGYSGNPGADGRGGGLLVTNGTVFIDRVSFNNNSAVGGNGGNGGNGRGPGAPYDDGGRGGDGGSGLGGAIYLTNGSLTINYGTFSGNEALGGHAGKGGNGTGVAGDGGHGGHGRGGAVYVNAGSLTVMQSHFTGDDAIGGNGGNGGTGGNNPGGMHGGNGGYGHGGSIYLGSGTMSLTDVNFADEDVVAGVAGWGVRRTGLVGQANGRNIYKHSGEIALSRVTFDVGANTYYNTASAVNAHSTVSIDMPEVNSGGHAFATVTVVLRDNNGIPVGSGKSVVLNQGIGRSQITPAVGTTDGNGRVTFSVANVYSETVTYQAVNTSDGFTLSQTVQVTFLPPDPELSLMTASVSSVVADGIDASTIIVTLKDLNGFPAPGKTVALSQGAGKSSIAPSTAITNTNGQAIFSVTSGHAETVTYTAQNTTDGFTVPPTVTVSFTPYQWVVSSLADTDTPGTLRHAINYAPAGEVITFERGLSGTITLTGPLPAINKDLTIDASGALVIVSGNEQHRVFRVDGGTVSITNLTIAHGRSAGSNGAVNVNGSNAGHAYGGGLYIAGGTVSIYNVAFNGNKAIGGRGGDGYSDHAYTSGQYGGHGGDGYGGSIYLYAGTLTIARSQFDGNSAIGGNGGNAPYTYVPTYGGRGGNGFGGSIFVNTGSLTVTDSQFTNNTVAGGQGGSGHSANGSNGGALYEDLYVYAGTCKANDVSFESGARSFYNPAKSDGATSTVAVSPAPVLSDGKKKATVKVTLRAADGSMQGSGKTVSLSSSSTSSTIVAVDEGLTNSYGIATFYVTDTSSGNITYTARDVTDNVLITEQATVSFLPSYPAESLIVTGTTSVIANASDTSTITVTIKFTNGDPARGKNITLVQGNGHSQIAPTSAVTDANGQATFTVANGYVEAVTYTGRNNTDSYDIPGSVTVTFTPYEWVVNSLADTNTFGTLRHALNYTQPGAAISFQPDLSGTITLTSALPTINRDLTIDATGAQVSVSGANQFRIFRIDNGTVAIKNLTLANGRHVGSPGAASHNEFGGMGEHGTGGALHISAGTVSIDNVIFQENMVKGGVGGYSTYNHGGSGGTGYGGAIYLHSGSLKVSNSVFADNSAAGGDGANGGMRGYSNYGGYPGHGGNGYGGAIFVNAGTLEISDCQFSGNTLAYGMGGIGNSYIWGHRGSNGVTLYEDLYAYGGTCTVSNVSFASGSYSYYNATPADGGQSTVTASQFRVMADGTEQSTIMVTLKYANGSSVGSGKTVVLSQGSGHSTMVSVNNGLTGNSGVATFTVTNTVAEAVTYTVRSTTDNVVLSQTAIVTFVPPDVNLSTVTASPSSVTADGTESSTITVTLKFANGNAASGKSVTLSQGSGSSIISPASVTTDSNGQAAFTVTNTSAEAVIYTATNTTDNITLPHTATVTFLLPYASKSDLTASTSSVTADGIESSVITVSLKHNNGEAAPGETVTLLQGSGHSIISPVRATTDSHGQASFTVTNGRAESVTYTVKVETYNATLPQTITITFTPYAWVVNTLDDTDVPGTLRHAISNAVPGATILFQSGLDGTITLHSQLPTISKDLIIDGAGAHVTVSGNNLYRVLQVDSGMVAIKNIGIVSGRSAGNDGVLENGGGHGTGGGLNIANGTVSIDNVTFNNNLAIGGRGGSIHSLGRNAGRGGDGYGGAINLHSGYLTIINSRFNDNCATGGHGGEASLGNGGGAATVGVELSSFGVAR